MALLWSNSTSMSTKLIGLLVGGVLPAFLLGMTGIFQKLSTNAGVGTGPFLIGAGVTTAIVGGGVYLV